jgi:hypothetical protein
MMLSPYDTELKLDLQLLEDQLAVVDIVVAREHAKIEVCYGFNLYGNLYCNGNLCCNVPICIIC